MKSKSLIKIKGPNLNRIFVKVKFRLSHLNKRNNWCAKIRKEKF